MSSIHERISRARAKKGLSMEKLAERVGLRSWQAVQQWENGTTAPKRKRLELVARELDVSVDYLLTGAGDGEAANDVDHAAVRLMVDVKIAAGKGRPIFSEDETKTLMFRRDWLLRHGITNADDAACFEVVGRSMVDAGIPDGSIVIVNLRQTEPQPNKIYVVRTEEGPIVKQLVLEDGRWIARSRNQGENGNHPDLPVGSEARVIGRAFWCGFEI